MIYATHALCLNTIHTHTHACTHIHMHVRMHAHVHTHMHAHIHTHAHNAAHITCLHIRVRVVTRETEEIPGYQDVGGSYSLLSDLLQTLSCHYISYIEVYA